MTIRLSTVNYRTVWSACLFIQTKKGLKYPEVQCCYFTYKNGLKSDVYI